MNKTLVLSIFSLVLAISVLAFTAFNYGYTLGSYDCKTYYLGR